ncbi:hypothetical protein ACROYT_G014071 [Oculina patagonica]
MVAYGFESLNAYGKRGTIAGTVGIQNSYPNTIVSYLRTTRAWQVFHERIGDDLMIHLWQNVLVFVKVHAKCYFQVAGHLICCLSPLTATEDVSPQLHSKQKSVDDEGGENAVLKKQQELLDLQKFELLPRPQMLKGYFRSKIKTEAVFPIVQWKGKLAAEVGSAVLC